MKHFTFLSFFLLFGLIHLNGQVSKTNSSQGSVTNGSGHIDRTFIYTAAEFGACTALTEVALDLQLKIGTGAACGTALGAYGVHEDLNVRLVSPTGTIVDLVQDRWGYWTGDPSQSHSFNGFTTVDATVNFDDDNSPNIISLNDWQAGSYAPHNQLSAFDGENPVGTWTLRISDGNAQFSTSDFFCYVTGTLIVTCGTAMPVDLTSFTAEQSQNNIFLNWSTASETNNEGFEIEHSVDGIEWRNIGFETGEGNTDLFSQYEFLHDSPALESNYYRLKQIDFNRKFEYSNIINVAMRDDQEISISPNPTNGIIRLNKFSEGEIKIYDTSGRVLKALNISDQEINISDLPSGILFIQVISKTQNTVKRILKE